MNQDLNEPNVQVGNMLVGYFTRVLTSDENGYEIPYTFWETYNLCDPTNAKRYKWKRGTGLGTFIKHLRTKHSAVFHLLEVVQYEPTEAPPTL